MLEIQEQLRSGKTVEEVCLPLGIVFKETNGEVIFTYDQIASISNKNHPIVKECRGLILNKADWSIAAMPFRRFMNYGEDGADALPSDLEGCFLLEKLDGSLLTLRWSATCNAWKVSTRKMIYAEGQVSDLSDMSFEKLFWEAASKTRIPKLIEYDILAKGYTYVFELCSPLNRIVTLYPESSVVLLTVRNNVTLQEAKLAEIENYSELFNCRTPKKYPFTDWNAIVNSFNETDPTFEGYVVLKEFSPNHLRVKVKSPKYLAISKLSVTKSTKAFIDLLKLGEKDEYLVYYPENKGYIDKIEDSLKSLISTITSDWGRIRSITDRKTYAFAVKECKNSPSFCLFAMYDGKVTPETLEQFIMKMPTEKIAGLLEGIK